MANALLDPASPEELAERGQAVEIEGKVDDFARLSRIVAADLAAVPDAGEAWREAPVAIRLDFSWADVRRQIPALRGRLEADIRAVCQRCLEPFELHVETDLNLLLMRTEDTADGGEVFEVWEYDTETLRPADIVEEALIMALPLAAMHDRREDCGALAGTVQDSQDASETDAARPFAGLRKQLDAADEATGFSGSGKKTGR